MLEGVESVPGLNLDWVSMAISAKFNIRHNNILWMAPWNAQALRCLPTKLVADSVVFGAKHRPSCSLELT
jgi:hypothetical protein